MWPRLGSSSFTTRWIVATLACSIISTLDGGWIARWFALAPSRIWTGQVWRLVTWPLVEPGPMQLVFTCIVIYKMGGDLAVRWGDRRLRRFVVEVALAAGVGTCVLSAVTGHFVFRLGGWAMADAIVIAWARQFPQRAMLVYGVLTLRGRDLIRLTLAVAVLFAIYVGPVAMAPELIACFVAAAYPRSLLNR
ncbi:MAG TPA: rhomboid family intramembrane serine protease [Kofleriaceae bacterium]|jgi:membrane associated rhomboid family serine protease|nr:rhomboid family intramembrane serine protease [Kofleriaceae bacterium]